MKHSSFLLSLLFLTACSTSVITDEERSEPIGDNEAVIENNAPLSADMSKSFIAFVGRKGSLSSHEGKFADFDFVLEPSEDDPEDLTKSSISVVIDVDSMETDSDGLTDHLKADDFFDVAQFPEAEFRSTEISQVAGTDFSIAGLLTMHGTTKPYTFPATITDDGLSIVSSIDRTDFSVGPAPGGVKGIDADVDLEVKIVFDN